jgi:hypothetical protein
VAVFACFSWSLFGFFNKLSSFILYFTLAEIAEIFAFMMAFSLLESSLATLVIVLLSALFPSRWLKDGFAVKGFIILIVASATAILLQHSLTDHFPSALILLTSSVGPILLIALLIMIVRSVPRLQSILVNIQDRILIMLFIYVPIGLFSLMVVIYRNLL